MLCIPVELLCFHEVPVEMKLRLDVLGPLVRYWIVGQCDCSLVVTIGEQEMKESRHCMKRFFCATEANATYSDSQALSATQASFLEAQDTILLWLFTLNQKPKVYFLSSYLFAQSGSEYPKSSNVGPC